ncbi:hypothetical protein ACJIZ3_011702 [Penstemon smallii]|uniref:tRNA (guanine-N(7)-)-methyltransferase non-catalytic subunit n=1 Tax=Penstemon smallii TaxID=265156 RepID=A0ABD3UNH0_9LAMI
MEDNNMEESEQKLETEVAPALITVHRPKNPYPSPSGRISGDGCGVKLIDENGGHKDSIRAIRYNKSGHLLVSAGDDKLVKIWDTNSWRCVHSVVSEKRVSALAISNDGMFVCFADKFGVVYVVDIGGDYDFENAALAKKKAFPILSHYCNIITRLEFSPDGRYIVSADRDFKIRVTLFPKNPVNGAHEIHSFCLGHTEFVSCLAFVSFKDYPNGFLVSGSGDSTVRLWDYASGSLLDTCDVGAEAGNLHSNGKQEDILSAVTDLCVTSEGSLVAVAIQSLPGIMILKCNPYTRTLSVAKGHFWLHYKNDSESLESDKLVLADKEVPGGELLLQALQGKLTIGNEAFVMAAEAVQTSMRNLLIKKQYSAERREFRKRGRNDKKNQTID